MPFTINEFNAQLSRTGGVALASNFECIITPPPLLATTFDVTRDLRYRVDSVDVPQRSIAPIEMRTYGPVSRMAGFATYGDITMTVILSPDYREREFFMSWQDIAIGPARQRGRTSASDRAIDFDSGYLDDYKSTIEINLYSSASSEENTGGLISQIPVVGAVVDLFTSRKPIKSAPPLYTIRLIDAYPSIVSSTQANWATPEVVRMPVTISYRYFEEDFTQLANQPDSIREGILQKLYKSGLGGAISVGAGAVLGRAISRR